MHHLLSRVYFHKKKGSYHIDKPYDVTFINLMLPRVVSVLREGHRWNLRSLRSYFGSTASESNSIDTLDPA